ncbi:hypothetical protein Trydic_g16786 [Trypoxylus dichotomus]
MLDNVREHPAVTVFQSFEKGEIMPLSPDLNTGHPQTPCTGSKMQPLIQLKHYESQLTRNRTEFRKKIFYEA